MSILSNIWGGIKKGISAIGNLGQSQLSNSLSAANDLIRQNTAAAQPNQTKIPTGAYPLSYSAPSVNQTNIPNMSTPGGASGGGVVYNQGGTVNTWGTLQANAGTIRSSTYAGDPSGTTGRGDIPPAPQNSWSAPADGSTAQAGRPFYDINGNYVVPKTGFGGMSGSGGSGIMSSTAPTGTPGVGGTDVARGYGSMGQGTTGGMYNQQTSDEEARKKQEQSGSQNLSVSQNPTQSAMNALAAQGQQLPPQTPSVPDTFDAGWLSKVQETINSTKGSAIPEQDKQAIYAQLQTNLMNSKAKLDQMNPIPQNPVVDTAEQEQFIAQSEDPFGVKQAIDQFRAEQTNLSQLQTTRVELMKNIQGLNDAYRPIMKEIKDNPNMPKALARRKIEALATTQKETMQGFLDQLSIIKEEIANQNEVVNRQFQIVNLSENQANRAQDDIRQNLQLYLSSGAIAGFTDLELKSFAQAANMPYNALLKAKEAALTPKVETSINEFADGTLRAIDKNTGKTLWSIPGAAKVGGATAGETFKSGGASIPGTAIAEGEQKLLASRGPDNYVDPTVYLNMYQTWTSKGGLLKDFVATYPPETYVNPANTWLPKEIMPKNKYSGIL